MQLIELYLMMSANAFLTGELHALTLPKEQKYRRISSYMKEMS